MLHIMLDSPGYIHRSIEPVLRRAARQFPAVVLTGPRQSGKTTLLRHCMGRRCGYASLELPENRELAAADPRAFLAEHRPPVIFDEIQYAPNLLPYIKEFIDADRDACGRYLLTGSQNLLMMQHVGETLAGRSAVLHLLPLSLRELRGEPDRPLAWEAGRKPSQPLTTHKDLWTQIHRGFFPELAVRPRLPLEMWYSSYLQTYIERDVRNLRQLGDLTLFRTFVRLLAARAGQLLDLTGISRDLGAAVNTVKAWISVLEASFQVLIIRPYHSNQGKRMVKTPRLYFTDTGLLCHLTGLTTPAAAEKGPLAGPLMQHVVLLELWKTLLARGQQPCIHFWRTSGGEEVDFVVEHEGKLVPVEVKASSTPRTAMAEQIERFRLDWPSSAQGYVVHAGEIEMPLPSNVRALPLGML